MYSNKQPKSLLIFLLLSLITGLLPCKHQSNQNKKDRNFQTKATQHEKRHQNRAILFSYLNGIELKQQGGDFPRDAIKIEAGRGVDGGPESDGGGLDGSKALEVSEGSGSADEEGSEVALDDASGRVSERTAPPATTGGKRRRRDGQGMESGFKSVDAIEERGDGMQATPELLLLVVVVMGLTEARFLAGPRKWLLGFLRRRRRGLKEARNEGFDKRV